MRALLIDIRQALRGLRKSPVLAAVATTSLALGIGANVTVYSVVREMILDDLSARRPDRLARVDGADVSYAEYRDLRAARIFEDLAYERGLSDRIWQAAGRSEMAWTFTTSPNFFDVLGIDASTGRLYSQSDEGRGMAAVSYGFWRKRLRGDPRAVGQSLRLNDRLYIIGGVLPRDYRSVLGHGVSPEVYLADAGDACRLFGRLRDGLSRQQSLQALAAASGTIGGQDFSRRISILRPMSGFTANAAKTGDERLYFLFFAMLFGVAGTLTLIACSNVAGLLLARALGRQRDLAIRKALGASRLQIARLLLAEACVLVLAGAGAGLMLDAVLRNNLSYVRWPTAYGIPFEFHFQNDSGLFLYASATAFAALLLSSLIPALRGSDAGVGVALKLGEPSISMRRWNLRGAFVILQVALSTVLLTLGAVFTQSFAQLVRTGPGFDVAHTLIAAVHPLPGRPRDLRQQVVRRITAVPGVESVTSAGTLPFMGELPDALLRRDGEPLSAIRHSYFMGAGDRYCATLGIPVLRGRDFEITDRERQPVPIIVNRTLASAFFGEADPIGEHLRLGRDKEELLEIVGVAANTKMRTMGEGEAPLFFRPEFNAQLLVRVAGRPAQWIEPLRAALSEVDGTAALDVRPMEDAAAGALFPMRVASGFVGLLSLCGLALALVGLYASVSFAVSRRTREFGIRAALGASRLRIVGTALRDGMAVLLCGAMAGACAAFLAIRTLLDLLPASVNPWAPAPFAAVLLLILATGAMAAWIPARRAGNVDPSIALRQD